MSAQNKRNSETFHFIYCVKVDVTVNESVFWILSLKLGNRCLSKKAQ